MHSTRSVRQELDAVDKKLALTLSTSICPNVSANAGWSCLYMPECFCACGSEDDVMVFFSNKMISHTLEFPSRGIYIYICVCVCVCVHIYKYTHTLMETMSG